MSVHKAVASYLGKDGCAKKNCAQAIGYAFKDKFAFSDDQLSELAMVGGGRAPQGVCGALYAAQVMLKEKEGAVAQACAASLEREAGSLKCREIRAARQLSCAGCVETVAKYLQDV